MKCPRCKTGQTAVIDKRTRDAQNRRRRECLECGYRFTTKEVPVERWEEIGLLYGALLNARGAAKAFLDDTERILQKGADHEAL